MLQRDTEQVVELPCSLDNNFQEGKNVLKKFKMAPTIDFQMVNK